MTKKNILLGASALATICTLYAFTHTKNSENSVLSLFFPDKKAVFAATYDFKTVETPDSLKPRFGDFMHPEGGDLIDLKDPAAVEQHVEYDPDNNIYIVTEKIGDDFFRSPTYMTFDEYTKWRAKKQQDEYFDRLQGVASADSKSSSGIVDPIAKFDIKNSLIDRLFGGTNVDIKPQGNINLSFGYKYQKVENPILTLRQQRNGNFDFDMDINMSAAGKIGEKLNLNFNYNTQATFDFDNQMKLHYDTKGFSEDEILQNIEAGNVSLPLRSNLIKGVQNLFGIRADMKFGHLKTTLIASQQRSKQQSLTVQGGSQVQTFEKPIDEYDENRHFFLSHWNRGEFEPSLKCLPVPLSLFNITRLEVWITNDKLETQNFRQIIAITDLAEPYPYLDTMTADQENYALPNPPSVDVKGQPLPDNNNNALYPRIIDELTSNGEDSTLRFTDRVVSRLTGPDFKLKQIRDFEKTSARLLNSSEFNYNEQLGFISINLNVQPDQVVGVACEYTYNGIPHKIGEFSSDVPATFDSINQNVLFVKMLKSTTANVKLPIWDLMMKNIYAVGSANVDPQEFRFDIFYEDPGKGQKRFLDGPLIPTAIRQKPLLQVFNLDNLNLQGDPGADGVFDFVPGLTINLRSGRVMFPVLEPFGSFLSNTITALDPTINVADLNNKLIYNQLYDSTLFRAREFQQLNRFVLKGSYKSAVTSEISLGTFNLPRGSVRVSAGGRQLTEGVDYQIDYNIGKLKILRDDILQSGQNVNVSFEDNTLFGFQNRSMIGARFDYALNKDVNLGATFMNLFERPLTQKVNFGDDPINNKVVGADVGISKDAPWLTKLVDKLPLISTKEPSSITAQAEVAALFPGHNKAVNQGNDKGGVVYIDDFEGSTSNFRLDVPFNNWVISSVPQGDNILFPENDALDSLALMANRARISWYIADPQARSGLDGDNPYTRQFNRQDIFPNRQLAPSERYDLPSFDVTLFPKERGPYNFELPNGYTGFSKGLTSAGLLNEPKTRWAGFMKGLNTNDFEAANIEFIEFWMLNPYMSKPEGISDAGDMYFDLGTISEDLMRDSRQFFENALPTGSNTGTTVNTRWGRVPVLAPVVNAFDNDPTKRALQDLGFDGLNDDGERIFYKKWVDAINGSSLLNDAKSELLADPSNDNFVYFGDTRYLDPNNPTGLIGRYRKFNNPEDNSPANNATGGGGGGFQNPSFTNLPDAEDLNRDNSLNETEAYFRYKIHLASIADPSNTAQKILDLNDPELKDLITDMKEVPGANGTSIWYRFKLPLDYRQRQTIGGIQDFRSIRFVRMLWKGFSEQTTFRFASLELGRNQWRRFTQNLPYLDDDIVPPTCDLAADFDVNAVSIEENAARVPFNYTIPFGISRENSVGAFPDVLQNEQSLSLNICGLCEKDARAIFKSLNMDLRQFKRLKMFVHAEDKSLARDLKSGDAKIFIRLGSDYVRNYYEYEIPLVPSDETKLNNNPDSREYKEEVWQPANSFDFPFAVFTDLKTKRNGLTNPDFEKPYINADPNLPQNNVKIVGNPNLGYVKGIMVGVRNIESNSQQCIEVWINELRLNGFDEQGGYAGQARVDMKLADLGNVSLAGAYSSIGWGGIDQRLIQRQREEIIQYDVSTNLELGKFLPEKIGLKVPFYAQYSNITRNPEYDPYDLDIKLKDKLRDTGDAAKRDSIRANSQDVTIVRGFNFTNVRKERRGTRKPLPFDISNFSFTYAYNNQERRTPFILKDEARTYRAGIDYQYATGLKPFEPFKKAKLNDKYFKFIKDLNFNPIPNTYGFSTNVERFTQQTIYRFAGEDPKLNTYYNRRFLWDRNYDLGWDIMKSLRFNFDATARSIIDEPLTFRADGTEVTKQQRRDSILTNIKQLGRPKNYAHNASLNYTLPFKVIPYMDWISVKASYTVGYTWTAQSLKLQNMDSGNFSKYLNSRSLGNVIQNNNVRQVNGELNFEGLYNKSKYLAKINKPGGSKPGIKTPGGKAPPGSNGKDNPDGKSGGRGDTDGLTPDGSDAGRLPGGGRDGKTPARDPKRADKNTPPNSTPPSDPASTAAAPGNVRPDGKGGVTDPANPNAADGKDGVAGKDGKSGKDAKNKDKDKDKNGKKKERQPSMAERIALRPLMLLRKGRFTYSENYSTIVPGFTPDTKLMGLSEGFSAPGWAFVAGIQPSSAWLDEAGRKGWITQRPELNQQVTRNFTQNFDAGVTIEPFQDFRIELTANRQYSRNGTELFKDQDFSLDPNDVDYQHRAQRDLGSFTTSFFALNTLFNNDLNGLFSRFEAHRLIISQRLGQEAGITDPHQEDKGYTRGFGKIQQQVLLPAFLAAYTDKDPNTVGLNVFKTRPSINWKLTYNGLSKVGNLKKIFASVQLSHGYKSTLTVSSYNTDIFYDQAQPYTVDELNFNYIARYEIPQVVISENFQPLIGVDVKMKNDMSFKVDFKKTRTLAMSFIDYQLAESRASAYSVGFGYRLKNVNIPFLTGKKTKKPASKSKTKKPAAPKPGAPPTPTTPQQQANDMNFRFDFEVRDDITINHRLDLPVEAVPTRGARTISINPSVDYALNRRLTLRLFTDFRKTVPKTSQSFPITTLSSGVTVQFKLN